MTASWAPMASWATVTSWTASSTIDPKAVADTSNAPRDQVRSADAVRARSASSAVNGASRDSPLSSVSSVNGVGANAPPPTESRAVHAADGLSSAERRGLTSLPYSLWTSRRALAEIATREPTLVQMLTSSSGFVVMTGAAMPFKWQTPDLPDLGLMIGIGLLGGLAQFLLIEGIRRAPASVVSPLEFSALVWSFLLGYWIWADVPGLNVFAGAVLITASGVFIVLEEWRKARSARAEVPAE